MHGGCSPCKAISRFGQVGNRRFFYGACSDCSSRYVRRYVKEKREIFVLHATKTRTAGVTDLACWLGVLERRVGGWRHFTAQLTAIRSERPRSAVSSQIQQPAWLLPPLFPVLTAAAAADSKTTCKAHPDPAPSNQQPKPAQPKPAAHLTAELYQHQTRTSVAIPDILVPAG